MFFDNQFDPGIPIYTQIIVRIKRRILTGEWSPGQRIPAVRELALEFGVNPNTMQRSLAELEREGLLFSERTAGRFITQDKARIEEARRQMSGEVVDGFIRQMEDLGFSRPEIAAAPARRMGLAPPGPDEGKAP